MACNNRGFVVFSYSFRRFKIRFFILSLISVFILCSSSFANILNPKEVLGIIENEDESQLHNFYQKLDNISLEEAQQFAETLFELVRNKYGNINFSEIRQSLSNILSNLDVSLVF